MQALTGGAFDPGLGAQMDVQRGQGPAGDVPRGRLLMDPEGFSVSVRDGTVALDLGAIGKGFALDRMAEELLAWDIDRALLVAGGSSLLALGGPTPGSAGWEIFLSPTQTLPLRRQAIGASGTAVKGAHILDPRTGLPTPGPHRAWAVHPSAATADALSTAWMLLEPDEIEQVCRQLPGTRAYLQPEEGQPAKIVAVGSYEDELTGGSAAGRRGRRHHEKTLALANVLQAAENGRGVLASASAVLPSAPGSKPKKVLMTTSAKAAPLMHSFMQPPRRAMRTGASWSLMFGP